MTTPYTIHTIQDLIRILDESPEWKEEIRRQILTDELMNMPAVLSAFIESTNTFIESTNAFIESTNAFIESANRQFRLFEERFDRLEADVATLRGDNLEMKMHRRILPLISQRLGLRAVRLVQNAFVWSEERLMNPLDEANFADIITDRQYNRILQTDAIVRGIDKQNGTPVWAGIEISGGVHENDITRAQATAEILSTVFGEKAVPVVIGYHIDPRDHELADRSDVAVLILDPQRMR